MMPAVSADVAANRASAAKINSRTGPTPLAHRAVPWRLRRATMLIDVILNFLLTSLAGDLSRVFGHIAEMLALAKFNSFS